MSNKSWKAKNGRQISKETHRLLTPLEILVRYPEAFFNDLGELIYKKKENRYIVSSMLVHLGKWHSGFSDELFIEKSEVAND